MPKCERYFHGSNVPPITLTQCGPHKEKVYGWKPDQNGVLQPCVVGEIDPDADIQACRKETLPEMMARMPGKSPLEKVQNAVNQGLVVPPAVDQGRTTYDLTGVPEDITTAMMLKQKAAEGYEKLPPELKAAEGATIEEKLVNFIKQYTEKQQAAATSPAEGDSK